MSAWRTAWVSFSSRFLPALYRRWRFSAFRSLNWSTLDTLRNAEPEYLLLPEFLGRPGCFLDVGSNTGHYLYAALRKKTASELFAVEPIPRLCTLLRRAFPGVSVHNLALTDSPGTKWLKIPAIGGRTFFTRATLNVDYQEPGETGQELIPVAAATLDAFWKGQGDRPLGCVKIDTEGHELSVLRGAQEVLARHRPLLLVEIEQRHHRDAIAGIVALLTGKGYACHYFDGAARELRPLSGDPADLQKDGGRYVNNFFFLPEEDDACREDLRRVNARLGAATPERTAAKLR